MWVGFLRGSEEFLIIIEGVCICLASEDWTFARGQVSSTECKYNVDALSLGSTDYVEIHVFR